MLAYLDALIAALSVRDGDEVDRLLAHPLARTLSDEARAEAVALGTGSRRSLAAPLLVMQLRHRTAELLRDEIPVADRAEGSAEMPPGTPAEAAAEPSRAPLLAPQLSRRSVRMQQMELPLSA